MRMMKVAPFASCSRWHPRRDRSTCVLAQRAGTTLLSGPLLTMASFGTPRGHSRCRRDARPAEARLLRLERDVLADAGGALVMRSTILLAGAVALGGVGSCEMDDLVSYNATPAFIKL